MHEGLVIEFDHIRLKRRGLHSRKLAGDPQAPGCAVKIELLKHSRNTVPAIEQHEASAAERAGARKRRAIRSHKALAQRWRLRGVYLVNGRCGSAIMRHEQ